MSKQFIHNIFGDKKSDKRLKWLDILLVTLICSIMIYASVVLYNSSRIDDDSNYESTSIPALVMIHNDGTASTNTFDTTNNIPTYVMVTSNINAPPILTPIDPEDFIIQRLYVAGDVVYIKYFNIWAIVVNKSILSDGEYRIIYRNNAHELCEIDIPYSFLLKPAPSLITPFTFTP